jgi:hypothetical protein
MSGNFTIDQVGAVIAVLGIYVALMSVLSVSVEAVIGWFKIPIPWLQGKPSPAVALKEVEAWLPGDEKSQLEARVQALNKVLAALGEAQIKENLTGAQLAAKVGEVTTVYIKKERARRAAIRGLAVIVGVVLAYVFQIDTLQILAPLSPEAPQLWLNALGKEGAHWAGLILSGMAASAGSGFWHDQMARLRNAKAIAEMATNVSGVSAG